MQIQKTLKIGCVILSTAILMTGCSRNIASNNYRASSVGEAMMSYQGTIISVRNVTSQEGDKLSDNMLGAGIGGVAGGLGGHMIGGGRGNTIATVGGALLGATAGAFAQRAMSEQNALEYTVKLTNGQIMTVVQGLDNPMQVGQRVIVQVSGQGSGGRSRVIPDASPAQDVQPIAAQPHTQVVTIRR